MRFCGRPADARHRPLPRGAHGLRRERQLGRLHGGRGYVADKLAALQQELYKDFVTTDQLAKADDARALTTENGKTMAEKAHKLGAELVEYITKDEALQPSVFTDAKEGAYYVDAVNWAVDKKVTSGKTETTFAPNDSCTRAQAVTFLWRAAGSPVVNYAMNFNDVDGGAYYAEAVRWAASLGIAGGYGDGRFGTNDFVTREQVAVFLARFADRVLDRYTPYMWDALFPFQDREQISYYARTAMNWACDLGLIKGIPGPGGLRLEPQSSATREQMAVMIARFCRRLNVWNEPMPEL